MLIFLIILTAILYYCVDMTPEQKAKCLKLHKIFCWILIGEMILIALIIFGVIGTILGAATTL